MIKLRVEWHHKCQGCGTKLVADFFADLTEDLVCPWCGLPCPSAQSACDDETRGYIEGAVAEIEEKVNCRKTVRG
ncbi:MAG: hypothetical protein ACYC64_16155 [Armatimonadota bacterium]